MEKCIGCYACVFACARRLGFVSVSKSAIQVKTHGGIERGFGVVVCHGCVKEEIPSCVKACKPGALKKRQGGGAVLNPDLCNSCGECVKACIIRAIVWDDDKKKPIMCIHCGNCAKYCPRGVLGLVKAEKELI
jgi:Fe-S-cluster-containing dehydrogenase component